MLSLVPTLGPAGDQQPRPPPKVRMTEGGGRRGYDGEGAGWRAARSGGGSTPMRAAPATDGEGHGVGQSVVE